MRCSSVVLWPVYVAVVGEAEIVWGAGIDALPWNLRVELSLERSPELMIRDKRQI